MIYLWRIPARWPNKLGGAYDHDHSPNYLLFSNGRKILEEELKKNFDKEEIDSPPIVEFEVSKDKLKEFDCLPNSGSAPLVNERLKKLLESLSPDDVQFFPAILKCAEGELEGYYFLNVTHAIKVTDFEKLVYEEVEDAQDPFQYDFDYIAYKPDCLGQHKFARDEYEHGNLLVSEDAALAMNAAKITGVRLIRPEDFYRPITAQDLIDAEKAM